jgi:D-lactate dehydrogenase
MSQRKVLFFDSKTYDEKTFKQALKVLNGQDKLHFTFLESKLTDETVNEARGFDAICVFVNDVVDAKVIEQCETVKIIALRSAGFNNVDLAAAEKYGIKICRVPRYSPYAVAEHSVALLLSLNRNLHHAFFRTKQHNFTLDGLVGIDLFGKTVGIIGTGGIGMCAINIFLGFGCKVLAHDIYPDEKAAKEKGFVYVTKDELLRQSDVGKVTEPFRYRWYDVSDCSVTVRTITRINLSFDQ